MKYLSILCFFFFVFAWNHPLVRKCSFGREIKNAGKNILSSAGSPPLLPAAGSGCWIRRFRRKTGRLQHRITYISTREEDTEKHGGISWTRSERHSFAEQEMIQDISSLSLSCLRSLRPGCRWQCCRGKLTLLKDEFHPLVFFGKWEITAVCLDSGA